VVEIEATFQGRNLSVRTVYSPPREINARQLENPADAKEYFQAMRRANWKLATSMFNRPPAQ
jgi:hypothetical protein